MKSVNPDAFECLLAQINEGFLFEQFAQDLLCEIVGIEFVPMGGVHDRGIDGLDHTYLKSDDDATIYQISIQVGAKDKIKATIEALRKNSITFARLFYVTNRTVKDKDLLIETFYKDYNISLTIWDSQWFRGRINHSEGTVRIYSEFVSSNTHRFSRPGEELSVVDFVTDPRVFVFLRQQLDSYGADQRLDELLVDSLILFSLEGTDPDKELFKTKAEILDSIRNLTAFDVKQLGDLIEPRLLALSTKPRRIRFYSDGDKYCLPFDTRLELEEKNIVDRALYETFREESGARLREHLTARSLSLKSSEHIISLTFNEIFKRQGLDFANFMLKDETSTTLEGELETIITSALENAGVAEINKSVVGRAALDSIRDIIYRGSEHEMEYLRRLSRSYLMLFLLKCDPHVCSYFDNLAANLRIFVCNSIIVPALSEIGLPEQNRRHWNLLVSAKNAGVKLIINSATMTELVMHIHRARKIYLENYAGTEGHYMDAQMLYYVPEILIRAYFHERLKGSQKTFDQFLNQFVSPGQTMALMAQELGTFLNEALGIEFKEDGALGVKLDESEVDALSEVLGGFKRTEHQARIDARTILTIYALRTADNEAGSTGAFGHRTWWLSKDTTTHRAVTDCYKANPRVSCYMRPDFLLSYITLSLTRRQANKVFDRMFPTLIGISISHHVSSEVCDAVHSAVRSHKDLSKARVKAVVGGMSTALMSKKLQPKFTSLQHYLDEEFRKTTYGT